MSDIVTALTGIFDQLNPFNIGNLVVFFAWIVVFAFTTVAVWAWVMHNMRDWLLFVTDLKTRIAVLHGCYGTIRPPV